MRSTALKAEAEKESAIPAPKLVQGCPSIFIHNCILTGTRRLAASVQRREKRPSATTRGATTVACRRQRRCLRHLEAGVSIVNRGKEGVG